MVSKRLALFGISAPMVLLLCGCATRKPVGVVSTGEQPVRGSIMIEPGGLTVVAAEAPAAVSMGIALGRTAYGGDSAGAAARSVLDPPNLQDPALEMAAGPVGFALAPFAAAYGALSAGHNKVPSATLVKAEADLVSAMEDMAVQRHFCDFVREMVGAQARSNGLTPTSSLPQDQCSDEAAIVLETRVDELRLERVGSSETSFALTIKARVRLSRTADSAVLYSQPLSYQSGTALFLDWTDPGVFERVANTGYRELAQRIAGRLEVATARDPVFVGAGFKHPSSRPTTSPVMFAAHGSTRRVASLVQVVSYRMADQQQMGIYSSQVPTSVTLQKPLTKDEAVSEAMTDLEWSLDGLHNSRNSVVQLSAIAVAIPLSLCKQTVAGVRGLSSKKLKTAEAQLLAATRRPDLQRKLAQEVAQQVTPRLAPPVMFVSGSNAAEVESEETALAVDVVSAALTGDGGVNPSLALCVEARATIFQPSDRVQLDSWPIHYRGKSRKFTEWAAGDARLFREELNRCHRQVATAIVDQLAARRLIGPDRTRQSVLAKN